MSLHKTVVKRLEKVEEERKHYENCTLDELIWLRCELESSHKFSDDTSSSYLALFVSFMIPTLTFMGGLLGTFVSLISSQIKVFTNEDTTKTVSLLKEILTFLVSNSNSMMYCFYGAFLAAIIIMFFSKLHSKKNHLRYLVLKELIEKAKDENKNQSLDSTSHQIT